MYLSGISNTIFTASVASCMVVCAALGETLCPVIVGNVSKRFKT